MRTKKLLALLCVAALVFPAVATVTNADAKAAESTQIVDESRFHGNVCFINTKLFYNDSFNFFKSTHSSFTSFQKQPSINIT
ncbi:MAG: hypothetical protein J6B02_04215 [Selenomonadales bacterium]|nr:hypothetical protein [Selenomonadales bacterium]